MKNHFFNSSIYFSLLFILFYFNLSFSQNIDSLPVKDKIILAGLKKLRDVRSGELYYSIKDKSFFGKDTSKKEIKLAFSYKADVDSFMFDMVVDEKSRIIYDLVHEHYISEKNKKYRTSEGIWWKIYQNYNSRNYLPITSKGLNIIKHIKTPGSKINLKDTVINKEKFRVMHLFIAKPDKDTVNFSDLEMYWYFSKKDLLPKKFVFVIQGFGKVQYQEYNLIKIKLNHINNQDFVRKINAEIAAYSNYSAFELPAKADTSLLPVSSVSPLWKLPNVKGDSIKLSDINAKLILLDFWYISCYPCQKAVPILVDLHKKYAEKGLHIIGINPYDKDTAAINLQLRRKEVNYKIVLDDKSVAKAYHVTAYPTFYLLDKNLRIIKTYKGYSENLGKELENAIEAEINKVK